MSGNAFAHYLGMVQAETFYQIKRGETGVSIDLALKINAAFPLFNPVWLIGAAPEPYRFNPSVSLVGKWEYTGVAILDLDTGTWQTSTGEHTHEIWNIPEQGVIDITVHGETVDDPEYSFDRITGTFVVRHDTFHIIRLTETEMEYADWSEAICKYVFRRLK